nr:DnaJ domain-containing protein [Microvirga roseola]
MVLYGIAAVALLLWILNSFTQANTAALAKVLKIVGGIAALGLAALFGLRGRLELAFLIGGFGAWLLGWSGFGIPGFGRGSQKSAGSVSRVRSALIEMELDHDTGDMDGSVLAGAFSGRRLSALGEAELQALLAECQAGDPDGGRLLEAYLDRRFPQWRGGAGTEEQAETPPRPSSGAMSQEEAYQVLGIEPGADPDAIRQAHRDLMKKLHPDQGGSTYLASRVNQAKEVLLDRGKS